MVVLANLAPPGSAVFVDSVGNTAAALAALGRALSLDVHVYAPLSTSAERVALLDGYGAKIHLVAGPRAASNAVAIAASSEALYLSHIYQPLFQAGMVSCAFELAEAWQAEVPIDAGPRRVVLSVGQGTLFLGLWHGFRSLVHAGVLAAPPILIGVRPETPGRTVAVGAGSVDPPRATEYREAARATGGTIFSVPETEIFDADAELRRAGFDVDPAASLAVAGWRRLVENDRTPSRDVVILCGSKREALPPRPPA
jgi:threonine synthase